MTVAQRMPRWPFSSWEVRRVHPGCALRWDDLDAGERELHVRRSLDLTRSEKLPKNGKQRIITVPPLALAAVSAMPRLLADDHIFHTVQGRRLSKSSLWYAWRPVRIAWTTAGLRDLDLYELRHAAATMLLERGVAHADVAVQLGHEDGGALVMARYGHPSRASAHDRLKAAYHE